ncbi:hypothetical protein BH10BAC5_BH10BAC5_07400 [soil metagenome]
MFFVFLRDLSVVINIIFLISISLSSVIFSSCKSDNSVTPVQQDTATNFRYPLTANSNWFHTTKDFVFNIRPDSIRHYFNQDTLTENGFSILKNDTTVNGISYKIFKTDHSSSAHAYTSLEYFRQSDSGLYCSAYFLDGNGFGPYRPGSDRIHFNGKKFNNTIELINYASGISSDNILTDQEYKCIAYPMTPGFSWFFKKIDAITDQFKVFHDYSLQTTAAGTFNCMVIQRKNIYGGVPDSNTILLDYYSKIGMLKRDYTIRNVAYTNASGQIIGYFDIKDEVNLNTYFVQQ